jgi:hypothetical protein
VSAVGRSLLVLFALGCHAHSPAAPVQGRAAGDDVTLYRD